MDKITQTELKEILDYNSDAGIFTWKNPLNTSLVVGSVAGTVNKKGYICIGVKKKLYRAHRLAWFYVHGVWPDQIDHINHVRTDNRLVNLRSASEKENSTNIGRSKANTSGVTGVKWHKRDELWEAAINFNSKRINLGRFTDFNEAVKVRKQAEIMYGFHPNHGKTKQEIQVFMDNAPEDL